MKEPAQVAFDAYGEDCAWKTFDGRDMPQWDDVGDDVRAHWRAGVAAVLPKAPTSEELAHRFQFHPADMQNTKDIHQAIRDKCLETASYIAEVVPPGREQALAITNQEQVMMWANAGVARGDGPRT